MNHALRSLHHLFCFSLSRLYFKSAMGTSRLVEVLLPAGKQVGIQHGALHEALSRKLLAAEWTPIDRNAVESSGRVRNTPFAHAENSIIWGARGFRISRLLPFPLKAAVFCRAVWSYYFLNYVTRIGSFILHLMRICCPFQRPNLPTKLM